MTYPTIILAQRCVPAPLGAVVIDYKHGRFWRDGICLSRTAYNRATTGFRIASVLIASGPGHVDSRRVFDAIWGDDIDGGPADAIAYSWVCLAKYRKVLDALGLHIKGDYKGGFEVREVSPAEIAALQERRRRAGQACIEGHRKARMSRRGRRPMPAMVVHA